MKLVDKSILSKDVNYMKRTSIYRLVLVGFLLINICFIGIELVKIYEKQIPESIKVVVGEESNFDFAIPASATVIDCSDCRKKIVEKEVNLNKPFSITSGQRGEYELNVKLFGLINLKKVDIQVIDDIKVIPCGNPIGIYVETDGVMSLGVGEVVSLDGTKSSPAENVVNSGDYILKVNGESVYNKKDLIQKINQYGKEEITLEIKRGNETINCKIKPVNTGENEYKIGVWVKDNLQGIGTLTFITDESFGALGHGINDTDTGEIVDIRGGSIYNAKIASIVKGSKGTPGELVGSIFYSEDQRIGEINVNCVYGIFGIPENLQIDNTQEMSIGLKQDVKLGKAYIRSFVSGEQKDYEIRILEIDMSNSDTSKGMKIEIVDNDLIELTNGIVQGMSGTPIIQNGKVIGAVTHVFVQNSTKGYGTFIENMLNSR